MTNKPHNNPHVQYLLPSYSHISEDSVKQDVDTNIANYGVQKVSPPRWHVLDWSSVTKHCFYGTSFKEYDPETDKKIPTVGGAVRFFFDVFGDMIFETFDGAPINIIIAKDAGINFRQNIFPGYKAKREKRKAEQQMDQEMRNLIHFKKVLEDVLVYAGATSIRVKGVEADDVAAWCTTGLAGSKLVYTNDHDLMSLAELPNVTVIMKGRLLDTDKYDVDKNVAKPFPLRYVTLFKSLVGDTSDEYPGVKQFGPAKWNDLYAVVGDAGLDELLKAVTTRKYDNLQAAAEHEGTPKPVKKALSLILKDTENWQVMYAIAKIRPELCWKPYANKLTQPEFRKRVPSKEKVAELMNSVGCSDVYDARMKEFMPTESLITQDNWSDSMPERIRVAVSDSPMISYDYETFDTLQHPDFNLAKTSGSTYVDVVSQEVTGASLCFGKNCQHSVYLSVAHKSDRNLSKQKLADLLESARDACRSEGKPFAAHNATFEMAVSVNSLGIEMWDTHDTMVMSQEVDENERSGLKLLSSQWLRYRQTEYSDVVEEGQTMADVTPEQVLHYGCDDSLVTSHLYWLEMIRSQLEGTYDFYCEYNVAPLNILAAERLKGVKMDWSVLRAIEAEDAKVHAESRKTIEQLLHDNLDKNSDGEFIAQVDNALRYFEEEREYYYCKAQSDAVKAWDKLNEKEEPSDHEKEILDAGYTRFVGQFVEDRIDKVKGDLLAASKYEKHTVEQVGAKFLPTAAGLRDLSKALDLPVIEKATKGYLSIYVDDNWQAFQTEDQKEFVKLLEAVTPVITSKDRTGDEFKAMEKFALRILKLEGKEVEKGFEITTSSPVKSRNLLYLLLGSKVHIRGKTSPGSLRRENNLPGSPAANALAFKWADAHTDKEWVKEVLDNLTKMSAAATRDGLYHKKYPLWRHPATGNIHPEFRWAATATGRPTGGNPNFLQISPVMRQTVVPDGEDKVLVGIDWAGLELRLTAGQSGDPTMVKAYVESDLLPSYRELFGDEVANRVAAIIEGSNGKIDLHCATGAGMAGMSYDNFVAAYRDESHDLHDKVNKVRKGAKVVNFGLIYGMSSVALSEKMIIDRHEGDGYVDSYFRTYPGVVDWQNSTESFARKNGYTKTAFGSVRHAEPELFTGEKYQQARIVRQLVNAEIQGSAADLLKITLSGMWKSGLYKQCNASYVLPIYDEVMSSVDEDQIGVFISGMKHLMEIVVPTRVPMPMETDVAVGYDWGNVSELGSMVNDMDAVRSKLSELKSKSKNLHVDYDVEVDVIEE